MSVSVVRYMRKKRLGIESSPNIYLLKQAAGTSKIYDLDALANDIEMAGSLSKEDILHVMKSFVRSIRNVLKEGNKVRVDGLGIFYITLTCPGVEVEKDCTIKNISRVNLRFKVASTLRLVNDSLATTRSAPNNVEFVMKTETAATGDNTGGTTPPDHTNPGGDEDDPNG